MSNEPRPAIAWQDTAVGLGILALAGLVAWQTTVIPENAVYAKVGPKVFPWISAALIGAMGSILTVTGLRGGWDHDEGGTTDWRSLGWLIAGLVANVALISHAGFIAAGTVLFVCTARAFGSHQAVRDAVIALALAIVAYVGFDRLLGYKIGSGHIEAIIGALIARLV